MRVGRGKLVSLATSGAGIAVLLAAAVVIIKPWLQERHWIRTLTAGDAREREAAAEALGEMKSVRAVPALAEALRAELGVRDPEMEWRAGRQEPDEEYFIAAMPVHAGLMYVKMHHSTGALVKIGSPAVPFLADCLEHPNMLVRLQAAFGLCMIGPEARGATKCSIP
jgi:HEAT repeat protein